MTTTTKSGRILAALMARADEGDTALDHAESYIASGGTILDLANELSSELGTVVRRDSLSRLLHDLDGARERLAEARRRAADALIEKAQKLIDDAPTDSREALAKTVKQVEFAQWRAERQSPGHWGGAKATTQVTISLNALHLDALRKFNKQPTRVLPVEVLPPEAEYEVVDG